jgi:hypothetical protein
MYRRAGRPDLDAVVHFGVDEHAAEAGVAARVAVEGRDAYQPVYAGLGTQVAVGVVAADLERAAGDACHLTVGLLQHLHLKTLALAKAHIHAHEHACPILGFGATRPGLDVDEAVVGVHRVAEHAAELELLNRLLQITDVGLYRCDSVPIVFATRHIEQFSSIGQTLADAVECADHRLQRFLFAAHVLGPLGVIPEVGGLAQADQFLEALMLGVVVKDTSAARRHDWRGH